MSHDWIEEQIINLIELIRDYTSIWNPQNEAYKDKNKRYEAFNYMATVVQHTTRVRYLLRRSFWH